MLLLLQVYKRQSIFLFELASRERLEHTCDLRQRRRTQFVVVAVVHAAACIRVDLVEREGHFCVGRHVSAFEREELGTYYLII